MQTYVDDLNVEIVTKANKLQMVQSQLKQMELECANQLREKDCEIQMLHDKIKKIKLKLRELRHSNSPYKYMFYFYSFFCSS